MVGIASLLTVALPALGASPYDLIPPLALDTELNYDFGGSTTLTRNEVRLTMENAGERGYLASKYDGSLLPVNFEMNIEFKVDGSGKNLYGDGMAFWFVEEVPGFGNLMGLNEFYHGAALVLDTYRNGKGGRAFPRLLLMKNDGTQPYDMANDGRENELDGCSMRGLHNNKRQDAAKLHISYSQTAKKFVVNMNYRGKWEPCIDTTVDLGVAKHIAVSAATGELTDIHTVRSIELIDLGSTIPNDVSNSQRFGVSREKVMREKSEERKVQVSFTLSVTGGIFKMLFKLFFGLIGLLALFILYKKIKLWKKRRDDNLYKLS